MGIHSSRCETCPQRIVCSDSVAMIDDMLSVMSQSRERPSSEIAFLTVRFETVTKRLNKPGPCLVDRGNDMSEHRNGRKPTKRLAS